MRLFFCLYLLILLVVAVPLHAQSNVYSQNLSSLDIQAIQVTRSENDLLVLEVEGIADVCGEVIITELYTEVTTDFISPPVGDSGRASSGRRYANLSIFILPEDEQNCDLEIPRVVSIEMPITIEMVNVPNYGDESFHDMVLLVNDFATWFYLVDENDTSSSGGQAIEFGETDLMRWQKIDSTLEDLYSVGADPGYAIPWIQGFHPNGCETVTHINFVLDPIEDDNYTAQVFRLLPMDSACPEDVQPFVGSALGVVPQSDIILNLGEMSHRIFGAISGDMEISTPVQRRYPTLVSTDIQAVDEGFSLQLIVSLSENCDVPISTAQVEIDNISFLNLYYDVTENSICTDEEHILEEHIIIPSLPLVINGTPVFE